MTADNFHGGFVAYTRANKTKALGVPADLLRQKGTVCDEVAIAMAQGALARSAATLAVAITGIAGPESDEDGNPVGLVCIANSKSTCIERNYGDLNRENIQHRAMTDALRHLIRLSRRS